MNLSNLRPPKGQKHKKRRIGQGMGPAEASTRAGAPRAPSPFPATARCAVSKAVRCRFTAVFRSAASPIFFVRSTPFINVGTLEKLEGDTFTPESLQASGVVKKLNATA
jgi:large subunit ribosomal protein L15